MQMDNVSVVREAIAAERPRLMKMARQRLGTSSDAEDVVQSACVRALEWAPRLKTKDNVSGWLGAIVRNLAIDLCRSRRRVTSQMFPDEVIANESEEAPAWAELSEDDVRGALATCSPALREVYELLVFRRFSYEDVARALCIPCGTVGSRFLRARRHLRAALEASMRRPSLERRATPSRQVNC